MYGIINKAIKDLVVTTLVMRHGVKFSKNFIILTTSLQLETYDDSHTDLVGAASKFQMLGLMRFFIY